MNIFISILEYSNKQYEDDVIEDEDALFEIPDNNVKNKLRNLNIPVIEINENIYDYAASGFPEDEYNVKICYSDKSISDVKNEDIHFYHEFTNKKTGEKINRISLYLKTKPVIKSYISIYNDSVVHIGTDKNILSENFWNVYPQAPYLAIFVTEEDTNNFLNYITDKNILQQLKTKFKEGKNLIYIDYD